MRSIIPVPELKPNAGGAEGQLAAAVDRVLRSPVFERTHRLCELLRYLTEQTLTGNSQALKEAAIGQAVFGRPATYNAADDNIVRANMRQLRLKLDEYYETAGAADPFRVSVPKGSYALKLVEQLPVAATPVRRLPRWVYFSAALLLAIAAVTFVMLRGRGGEMRKPPTSLLSLLMPEPGQKVLIVAPDSGVQFYREFTERAVPLEEYLNRRYAEPENLKRVAPNLPPRVVHLFSASVTEMFVANLIPSFAKVVPPDALSVPPPISLTVKDFERDNAVLISGPMGNPWVQLFDRSLNFQIVSNEDQKTVSHIVNRHPLGSEKSAYFNFTDSSNTVVCYSRLACLPGMSSKTRVILAGGPHSASTQAAALFLTQPELLQSIRRLLPKRAKDELPWFEAVVEARALGTEPWTARIAAIRTVEAHTAASSQ